MPMDSKDKQKQISKNKTFGQSFRFAMTGIKTAYIEEKNMKKHGIFGMLAILLGFILQITISEWLWILFCIFFVITLEIVNTSFENIVDLVTENQFHPIAKKVKDMAAGAVLTASVFSCVVASIIFIPKILPIIK
ncbi:diacylglycerol kinase family protein [Vagococcus entomophilus]|uniref:UDP kinase n=1 Tax=Vagococcus entomophilus TaxID=1160095 RepID=A0A430AIU2_9ENTE|nr:diacylglycerol kinase family protein [Vagococcus entomophilus]RSU08022.1 UDP kinase [Vagococcus entomophilus]